MQLVKDAAWQACKKKAASLGLVPQNWQLDERALVAKVLASEDGQLLYDVAMNGTFSTYSLKEARETIRKSADTGLWQQALELIDRWSQ